MKEDLNLIFEVEIWFFHNLVPFKMISFTWWENLKLTKYFTDRFFVIFQDEKSNYYIIRHESYNILDLCKYVKFMQNMHFMQIICSIYTNMSSSCKICILCK